MDLGREAWGDNPAMPDTDDAAAVPTNFRRSRRSIAIEMILLTSASASIPQHFGSDYRKSSAPALCTPVGSVALEELTA
jgi:hypothetical protein